MIDIVAQNTLLDSSDPSPPLQNQVLYIYVKTCYIPLTCSKTFNPNIRIMSTMGIAYATVAAFKESTLFSSTPYVCHPDDTGAMHEIPYNR